MDTRKINGEKMSWTRKLIRLVGQCIEHERDGYDALASAAWDEIREHWNKCDRRENEDDEA